MKRAIHHFRDSGEAYDACQCRDDIKNGDFLVVKSEGVIGIADTWPWAITKEAGYLHELVDFEGDPKAVAARADARAMGVFDLI